MCDADLRRFVIGVDSALHLWVISDLSGPRRLQSELARCGLEFVRRDGAFFFESESLVLFHQSLALAAQGFVFVTKLHGGEVLLGGKHKPTGQDQSAEQQHRESRQRGDVSTATNFCV